MLLVGRARKGDRQAFAALVQRRQTWIRNLMRRCCGDAILADDLAQQVFLQAWRTMPQLQRPSRFAAWLKRMAVNIWLQYLRKNDPLKNAAEFNETVQAKQDTTAIAMDLDQALGALAHDQRLCVVLSYHERMNHAEIAGFTGLPLGTVKSHIRRGTNRLKQLLSAYAESSQAEETQ
ncbi:MAG: RNA polymerase sigma factor [Woeseiaceae bacterium]